MIYRCRLQTHPYQPQAYQDNHPRPDHLSHPRCPVDSRRAGHLAPTCGCILLDGQRVGDLLVHHIRPVRGIAPAAVVLEVIAELRCDGLTAGIGYEEDAGASVTDSILDASGREGKGQQEGRVEALTRPCTAHAYIRYTSQT